MRICPLLLLRNAVLHFRLAFLNAFRSLHNHIARTSLRLGGNKNGLSAVFRSFPTSTTDEGFKVWINLLAESSFPACKNSRKSFNWFESMVMKCAWVPIFGRSRWNNMACRKRSIEVSKYIQFFRLSCNIQTLFYWGRKGELYTSYHIRLISKYKDLKTKVVSWFSLVIGQNASRQLATSSENLVASAQFLVALATSESQFRAL